MTQGLVPYSQAGQEKGLWGWNGGVKNKKRSTTVKEQKSGKAKPLGHLCSLQSSVHFSHIASLTLPGHLPFHLCQKSRAAVLYRHSWPRCSYGEATVGWRGVRGNSFSPACLTAAPDDALWVKQCLHSLWVKEGWQHMPICFLDFWVVSLCCWHL